MAATGKTPILLYGSTTASNAPAAGNLTNSSDGCEIAINVADKNLFFKDSTNAVNTVPIRQSSASSNGWLSSTDWSTFNNKVSSPWVVSGSNIYYNAGIVASGSTISAWNTNLNVVQVNGGGVSNNGLTTLFTSNLYYDSGYTPKYIATGVAGSILYNPTGTGGWAFYVAASGSAGATATPTQAATIHNSGGVSIGNTTDPGAGSLNVNSALRVSNTSTPSGNGGFGGETFIAGASGANVGLFFSNSSANAGVPLTIARPTDGPGIYFFRNGSAAGYIQITTGAISVNNSSDYRLKENVKELTGSLSKILQVRPVTFNWIENGSDGKSVIAHELQQLFPDVVFGEKDAVNEDGSIKPQSVALGNLIPDLIVAIKEQQSIIDELTTRIKALEDK